MTGTAGPTPVVSVALITYNQERLIAQAIESVLMQETTFPWELVIGEDCSTDRTRRVVEDLARVHPDRIRLLPAEPNLGMMRNFVRTIRVCRGRSRFVALLEGDDYWTSAGKLQRQVEFFEAHPECAICFHAIREERANSGFSVRRPSARPELLDLEDLLVENFAYTCTAMFRTGLAWEFPEWYFGLPVGDYPLFALIAEQGRIGFIDEVMAAYRVHEGGVWSSQSRAGQLETEIGMLSVLQDHLQPRHRPGVRRRRSQLQYKLALAHERGREPGKALRALLTSLREAPVNRTIPGWERARLAARLLRPRSWVRGGPGRPQTGF